ncbi:ORF-31 [Teiidae poxvirus 1]|nr:ORF-31 [Teiidae poxvirus 1]
MGEYYKNKLLLRPCVFSDNTQIIKLVAYEYKELRVAYPFSIVGVVKTRDNKFLLCHRKHSFLFSEIVLSRDKQRKRKLFQQHSKYLSSRERTILSSKLSLPNRYINNHTDITFPGGKIKERESIVNCLLREVKEETNIESSHLAICENCFAHGIIYDRLINKDFKVIILYADVKLNSEEVMNNFIPNKEVSNLSFTDTDDNSLYTDIINYIVSAVGAVRKNKGYFFFSDKI